LCVCDPKLVQNLDWHTRFTLRFILNSYTKPKHIIEMEVILFKFILFIELVQICFFLKLLLFLTFCFILHVIFEMPCKYFDNFYYVCSEATFLSQKHAVTSLIKIVYQHYFNYKVRNQVKLWTHISSNSYTIFRG